MLEHQAYDIRTFAKAYAISRSQAYLEIKSGRLAIFKVGRRTLISRHAAEVWRQKLEDERVRSLEVPADLVRHASASHVSAPDNKSDAIGAEPGKAVQRPVERP